MRRLLPLLALVAILWSTGCQLTSGAPPRIIVDHSTELLDAPLATRVEGIRPDVAVTIRAQIRARSGTIWSSSATFKAGADGRVDLARANAGAGSSYTGADAMGLFWSLGPSTPGAATLWAMPPEAEAVTLTAGPVGAASASLTVNPKFPRAPELNPN